MMPKFLRLSDTTVDTTMSPLSPFMPPCSCLPYVTSVGVKVFITGCDYFLPRVDGKTILAIVVTISKQSAGSCNWGETMKST